MASNEFTSLADGFNGLGQTIANVLKDKYATYFVVLGVLFTILLTLFRNIIGKLPLFEGDGDRPCNGQGSVLSVCLALLCVVSLGWSTKDKGGPDAIINAFAGPWGYFIVIGLSLTAGYGTFRALSEWGPDARKFWTILACGVTYFYLQSVISSQSGTPQYGSLYLFIAVALIVGVLAFLKNKVTKKDLD